MSDSSNDLSIQLQQNGQQKSNIQILNELQEMTQKMIESDRKEQIYRQMRKNKTSQVQKLKKAYREVFQDKQQVKKQFNRVSNSLKEVRNLTDSNTVYMEVINKKYQNNFLREKQVQTKNTNLVKQNQKLEKAIQQMQQDLQSILKSNKDKHEVLTNLKQQKLAKNNQIKQNQNIILNLQRGCQSSKISAEKLQQQIRGQIQLEKELRQDIQQKQNKLIRLKDQKQQKSRREKEQDKLILKTKDKILVMQTQIDKKINEMQKLQNIHGQMQKEIKRLEQSQLKFQKIMQKRRELIASLQRASDKVEEQKQLNQKITSNNIN